jgi:hypothetical protein
VKAKLIAMPGASRGTFPIAADGKHAVHYGLGDTIEVPPSLAESLVRDGLAKVISEPVDDPEAPAESRATVVLLCDPWNGSGHREAQLKVEETFRLLYRTCLGVPLTSRGWADLDKGMVGSLVDCLTPLVRYHCAKAPVDLDATENVLCRIARSINPGPLGPFPTFPFVPTEVLEIVRPALVRAINSELERVCSSSKKEKSL